MIAIIIITAIERKMKLTSSGVDRPSAYLCMTFGKTDEHELLNFKIVAGQHYISCLTLESKVSYKPPLLLKSGRPQLVLIPALLNEIIEIDQ